MKKQTGTVDEYIGMAPEWSRKNLKELRKAIKSVAPKAKESISYNMPYYNQNGRLAYFASYTNHCSFHWVNADDKKMFAKDLVSQNVAGSTIHFLKGDKVPILLIKKIVKNRLRNNLLRVK